MRMAPSGLWHRLIALRETVSARSQFFGGRLAPTLSPDPLHGRIPECKGSV